MCNLGSVNLPQHIEGGELNLASCMLDSVIDINYYSVPQAETSNFRHRPIGLV